MIIRSPKLSAPATRGRQLTAAQKRIVESKCSKYINLSCGHTSTWEVDSLYSFNRPAKNKSWCEHCDKWTNIIRPQNIGNQSTYPDEPMF